jgi:hypothetical protein
MRPQVWGTIIFLLVVSTAAGLYFANLEEFLADGNQEKPTLSRENQAESDDARESSISIEDRAIAADIDVSAVLENDLAANAETLQAAPERETGNLFDQFMKQRQARNQAANSSEGQANQQPAAVNIEDNPFTIRFPTANNAGRNNAATSTNPFLFSQPNNTSNGLSLPDTTTPNLNNANALQTSLDRANGYNRPTNLDLNGNDTNPLQSAIDRLNTPTNNSNNTTNTNQTTTNNNPNNNPHNINLIAQPEQLNPLLGTTPYNPALNPNAVPAQGTIPLSPYSNVPYTPVPGQINTPNSLNPYNPGLTTNPPNSYTYLNQPVPNQPINPVVPPAAQINPTIVPALPGTTTDIYNSNLPNPAVQPIPNQLQTTPAPFSIPNNIPGRNIGGGQINTFSNP